MSRNRNGMPSRDILKLTPAARAAIARIEQAKAESDAPKVPLICAVVSDLESKRVIMNAQLENGRRAVAAAAHSAFSDVHRAELEAYVALAEESLRELERHIAFATHVAIPHYAKDASDVIEHARGISRAIEASVRKVSEAPSESPSPPAPQPGTPPTDPSPAS